MINEIKIMFVEALLAYVSGEKPKERIPIVSLFAG